MDAKKVISSILLASLFTITSCNKGNNSGDNTPERVFMKNGFSNYSIVIDENAQSYESYAASELALRLLEATEIEFSIVNPNQLKEGTFYISLGNTSLFKENINANISSIDGTQSAYYRTYKDGNIYIVSSSDFNGAGVLYGVYDLLEEMVDYEYYYVDEVYVNKTKNIKFKEYEDKFVRPTFDCRTISVNSLMADHDYCKRLRNIMPAPSTGEWDYSTWGHGQITYFVPFSVYGAAHPDWYMNTSGAAHGNQLCLMAGKEMEDVVFEAFKKYISKDLTATYFMFAQQDINHGCSCAKCTEAINTWAGCHQGIQVDFLNRMISRVEEWLNENQPGRTIYYAVFAYNHTYNAPMYQDDNGNYQYYSDRVIPNKKIRFIVAPVEANYSYSFNAPINSDILSILKKWKAYASGQTISYSYDVNFKYYFINFNNFGAIQQSMKILADSGITYYLTQGDSDTRNGCFNEMRAYVESKLLWNVDLDYNTLVNEFMDHFYKNAKDNLRYIYDMIRDQYALYDTYYTNPSGLNIYANILSKDLWPYDSVRQMEKQINKAFESIEHYLSTDPELYATLSQRIYKEYLTVIYLKVKLYKSYCTDEELEYLKGIWDTYTKFFGFTQEAEGVSLDDIF